MIRSGRSFFLRRNNYSTPFLTQRTPSLPNQDFLEFSKLSQPESKSFIEKTEAKKSTISFDLQSTAQNVKYDVFKRVLQGTTSELKSSKEKDLFLTSFFNNLMQVPPFEIIKTLKMIVFSKSRPITAINTLCDALLLKTNQELTESECCDLLFCLSKLQYRHEKIIEFSVNYLKQNTNSIESPKVITSLLHSLALLRVRDCEVLDKLIKSQLEHPFDIKSNLSALITLSILNFSSKHLDSLIKPLSQFNEIDFHQSKDYITFIWTCVLLDKFDYISEKHLENVLSKTFIENFEYCLSEENVGLRLKLLNINTAASLLPSYKGPLLQSLPSYNNFIQNVSSQRSIFMNSLKDSLVYIVGKDGFSESTEDSSLKLYLDLECRINLKNSSAILSKPIDDAKVGIVLQNYSDICNDGTMTGLFAFKLKVLHAQDYKIVVIPHNEYPVNGKLSEKIAYLRKKIRFVIEGEKKVSKENNKVKERA